MKKFVLFAFLFIFGFVSYSHATTKDQPALSNSGDTESVPYAKLVEVDSNAANVAASQDKDFTSIIRLQPNDPYYVDRFAKWGPMYRVTDPRGAVRSFTLSSPALWVDWLKFSVYRMKHRAAVGRFKKDESLSNYPYTLAYHQGVCEKLYARVPSPEQFEALTRALSVTGKYAPLRGMEDRRFWSWEDDRSESSSGGGNAFFFNGPTGDVGSTERRDELFVVCVSREGPPK